MAQVCLGESHAWLVVEQINPQSLLRKLAHASSTCEHGVSPLIRYCGSRLNKTEHSQRDQHGTAPLPFSPGPRPCPATPPAPPSHARGLPGTCDWQRPQLGKLPEAESPGLLVEALILIPVGFQSTAPREIPRRHSAMSEVLPCFELRAAPPTAEPLPPGLPGSPPSSPPGR